LVPGLSDRLRAITGLALPDIAGASLPGEIPLTAAAVNRLIAERLPAARGPFAAVHVVAHEGQRFTATVSLRAPSLVPAVTIAARIERQPEFPHRPVLGLRWSVPGLGPLARVAASIVTSFKTLPAGLRLEGDLLWVDLGELLRARGLGDVPGLITRLHVETRPGTFVVHLDARL
jgi:hypothetical protein